MDNDHFYKNAKNSADGYNPYCIKCTIKKSNKYAETNFDSISQHKHKYHIAHKEHINIKCKRWRTNNRKHKQEYQKEYQQKHPEQMKIYSEHRQSKQHNITKQEWISCKSYFGNYCAYCGMTEEKHKELIGTDFHKEHVVFNGANDLSNCVPSCRDCNSKKWKFSLDEWYNEKNPNYTKERYDKIMKWITEDYKKYIQPTKPKGKYTKKKY